MDYAGMEPVRIERRGRDATVLIPESEYRKLRNRIFAGENSPNAALARLKAMALGSEATVKKSKLNARSAAILSKHS